MTKKTGLKMSPELCPAGWPSPELNQSPSDRPSEENQRLACSRVGRGPYVLSTGAGGE